jgi:hypothetical protein
MADMVRLAGIDVSKDKLDVYVEPSGERRTWRPAAATNGR